MLSSRNTLVHLIFFPFLLYEIFNHYESNYPYIFRTGYHEVPEESWRRMYPALRITGEKHIIIPSVYNNINNKKNSSNKTELKANSSNKQPMIFSSDSMQILFTLLFALAGMAIFIIVYIPRVSISVY